jgi:hypothetical protein
MKTRLFSVLLLAVIGVSPARAGEVACEAAVREAMTAYLDFDGPRLSKIFDGALLERYRNYVIRNVEADRDGFWKHIVGSIGWEGLTSKPRAWSFERVMAVAAAATPWKERESLRFRSNFVLLGCAVSGSEATATVWEHMPNAFPRLLRLRLRKGTVGWLVVEWPYGTYLSLPEEKPNKAPEPTPGSVTSRAD